MGVHDMMILGLVFCVCGERFVSESELPEKDRTSPAVVNGNSEKGVGGDHRIKGDLIGI